MAETYKERLVREHPNWRDEAIAKAVETDCPYELGYGEAPEFTWCREHKCEDCWNREVPEEKEKAYMNHDITPDYKDQIQIATLKDQLEQYEKLNKTLEQRLEKYKLVVRCIEAFTGEKLNIE